MDGRSEWLGPLDRRASSEQPWLGADATVTETVEEQVVQACAREEAVAARAASGAGPHLAEATAVGHTRRHADPVGGNGRQQRAHDERPP